MSSCSQQLHVKPVRFCFFRLACLLALRLMDLLADAVSPMSAWSAGVDPRSSDGDVMEAVSQITLPTQEDAHADATDDESGDRFEIAPPAVKRRRLRGKQPDPCGASRPQSRDLVKDEGGMSVSNSCKEERLSRREFQHFYYRLRRWREKLAAGFEGEDEARANSNPFKALDRVGKYEMLKKWAADDDGADPVVKRRALAFFQAKAAPETQNGEGQSYACRSESLLLTWNGDWGLLPLAAAGGAWVAVKELCTRLSLSPALASLAASIRSSSEKWKQQYTCTESAWSIELSVKRYEEALALLQRDHARRLEEDPQATPCIPSSLGSLTAAERQLSRYPLRVHVHCYLRFRTRQRHQLSEDFMLRGSIPVRGGLAHCSGSRNKDPGAVGMYYLQCPKIGSIMSGGASRPFDTYLVNPQWIQNLVQLGKMTVEDARIEMLRTAKCLPRNLENLERLQQEKRRLELAEHIRSVQKQLDAKRKQAKVLPAVTQWLQSFATVEQRYAFLVLDGPSRTGKSVFSRSLSPCPENFLEVDCSGTEYPDLRDFKPLQHTVVLFDEATPTLVLRNKKLFQASASKCKMASSPTNLNAYDVWFHQVRIIVASNKWEQQLNAMCHEDATWINANSVYVRVTGPLWEEGPTLEPLAQQFEPSSQASTWCGAALQ